MLCDENEADRTLQGLMHSRLAAGYFNVVVVTNARNLFCNIASDYGHDVLSTLNGYLESFPNTVVVTVDGSDFCGCHTTFADQLRHVDLHFPRNIFGSLLRRLPPSRWMRGGPLIEITV